jgi:hypothetical protein
MFRVLNGKSAGLGFLWEQVISCIFIARAAVP